MSSLKERFAAKLEQRLRENTYELPVPGFEDIGLWARYRPLSYEETRGIGLRNVKGEITPEAELAVYADTIIRACVELLEKTGEDEKGTPQFQSLGGKWDAPTVRDKLGVDLPGDATARQAVFAVFNGTRGGIDLAYHCQAVDAMADQVGESIAEELPGESEPGDPGLSRSEPEQPQPVSP